MPGCQKVGSRRRFTSSAPPDGLLSEGVVTVTRMAEGSDDTDRDGTGNNHPDSDVADLHLATVVVNVRDMKRAVGFWSAALGYQPRETAWDPEFMMLVDPAGKRLPVSMQLTDTDPKEPVRVHVDLYTAEQDRHVKRLVELGATRVEDWPYPDDCDFIVLRDPDGNEFCVIDHRPL